MALPLYKILEINDAQEGSLWNLLDAAPIGTLPVAVDISKLGERQRHTLEVIEAYFDIRKIHDFPYPFYVVASIAGHSGKLSVFPSQSALPRYYRKKNRPLNMKENAMMAKVALKQKKLSSVNQEEFSAVKRAYAERHKILFKKQSYLQYLEGLLGELRGLK